MRMAIEAGGTWTHPEMDRIPDWRGCMLAIISDLFHLEKIKNKKYAL